MRWFKEYQKLLSEIKSDGKNWKRAKRFSGVFACEDGRIKRIVLNKNSLVLREPTQSLDKDGYKKITLMKYGIRKTLMAHQIILEAFVGYRPTDYQAMHGVKGKKDNSVSNLSWGTRSENNMQKYRDGTMPCGEKSPCAKLKKSEVFKIIDHIRYMVDFGYIARKFNVSHAMIYRIAHGLAWKHLGE